jgi:signal transduction histidine kinase
MTAVSNSPPDMDAEHFLATTISTLASSPEFPATINNLARLAVPGLADWCAIFTLENADLNAPAGPGHVLRTGRSESLTNITDEVAAALGFKLAELPLPNGNKPSIYLCVPLVARDRTIGAMALICAEPKTRFDETELPLIASLADAAAAAIESAALYREAQKANQLKDDFVSMVSHELRTPLTPILGCIHLLRTAGLSQANFDRALEMIERNARTQLQTIEDLVDASRIVSGKLRLTLESTMLVPVIEAAIETVRPLAEAKGVQIITDFTGGQQPIDGDPNRLQQIVWNLLSNAVKFTPSGGRIEISLIPDENDVRLKVTDTGSGIRPDFLPSIFDRFRQTPDTHSKPGPGLGLGLMIVRHLVELHHGSIQAASAGPDCGSVFTVRFPLLAQKAAGAT